MFRHIHKIICIVIIAVFAQIGSIVCRSIPLAILCILHKRGIGEEYEPVATAVLRCLHEILMSCTFAPVV